MGEMVVTEFISLDGVMEGPGSNDPFEHAGWSFDFDRGDEGDQFKADELMAADVQLLGRITYEGFAANWPAMRESAGEFGEKMNSMPKYVVSTTLSDEEASWENSTVIRDDVPGAVRKLKQAGRGRHPDPGQRQAHTLLGGRGAHRPDQPDDVPDRARDGKAPLPGGHPALDARARHRGAGGVRRCPRAHVPSEALSRVASRPSGAISRRGEPACRW